MKILAKKIIYSGEDVEKIRLEAQKMDPKPPITIKPGDLKEFVVADVKFCCPAMDDAYNGNAIGFGNREKDHPNRNKDINIYQAEVFPEGVSWSPQAITWCPFCSINVSVEIKEQG